jgi:hypothetical protein
MAIDHAVFDSMLERARTYRREIVDLGSHGEVIEENVLARLAGKREFVHLPPATATLADEIFALLGNPRLSEWQTHAIRRAFFMHGGETGQRERSAP